ncbi:MAG TPA: signal peptidase I [Candidatus Limnocylindrales bacterium]
MIQRPRLGCLFEIVETLVLTLVIFLVIQNFVAQPYRVEQGSMERTLEPDQYVLVDKLTPRFEPYQRGDVVVFTPPPGYQRAGGAPFIKRVIGVAGDKVEVKGGEVFVNGTVLREPYLFAETLGAAPEPTIASQESWTVPDGQLFLLGDHRAVSEDSRTFGTIPTTSVIGRAWLRYWPINVFGVLQTPTYR